MLRALSLVALCAASSTHALTLQTHTNVDDFFLASGGAGDFFLPNGSGGIETFDGIIPDDIEPGQIPEFIALQSLTVSYATNPASGFAGDLALGETFNQFGFPNRSLSVLPNVGESLTFNFFQPVTAVGISLFGAGEQGPAPIFNLFGPDGVAAYAPDFVDPLGQFFGFTSDVAFTGMTLVNTSFDEYSVDNLLFDSTPGDVFFAQTNTPPVLSAPLPGSATLLGGVLLAFAAWRRARRR